MNLLGSLLSAELQLTFLPAAADAVWPKMHVSQAIDRMNKYNFCLYSFVYDGTAEQLAFKLTLSFSKYSNLCSETAEHKRTTVGL